MYSKFNIKATMERLPFDAIHDGCLSYSLFHYRLRRQKKIGVLVEAIDVASSAARTEWFVPDIETT